MKVVKRDGSEEDIKFDKIHQRIKSLSKDLNVEIDVITQKAIERLYNGIKTREMDEHLASITINHSVHPHYSILAGRIAISSLHKETSFNKLLDSEKDKALKLLKSSKMDEDHKYIKKIKNSLFEDPKREKLLTDYLSGKTMKEEDLEFLVKLPRFFNCVKTLAEDNLLSKDLIEVVDKHRDKIEAKIDYSRDFMFEYFGYKTLEKSYLLKKYTKISKEKDVIVDGKPTGEKRVTTETISQIVERPQDMFMRVSLGIFGYDLENAFQLYDYLSEGWYTHATPTLFNSGTRKPQMSSCFLIANGGDSIEDIFDTFKEEALISKSAGGIGVWYSNIRAAGSVIKGTNGISNGILPFLRIKNQVAKGIDQGGGKRPGSMAVYLEPWHADVKQFIHLRKKTGDSDIRTRDLHLALWIPDLFWDRVREGGKWSLFDPSTAPNLYERTGTEFKLLYESYEKDGRAVEILDAREFLKDIFECLIETGEPYMLNKDHANLKSNQQNLGVIKSSNLCTEIIQFSSKKETAVCNLASWCLPKFVKNGKFDHEALHKSVKFGVVALNQVIDVNHYVNEKTRFSNMRHRPVGIGVQGLADVFFKLRIPYTSDEAMKLNEEIFETIYHAAVESSMELAKKNGHYESMNENGGAPITKGLLQFDLWNHTPKSNRYDWDKLKEKVKKTGLRNSLLVAPMPTASTSQIFGNTESFEPLTENIYKRKTGAGEFTVVNKYLIYHLEEQGLWNRDVLEHLIKTNGSLLTYPKVSPEFREIYKTVWELSLKKQLDMAADRGAYICQSQSFNIHMDKPSMERLKDVYLYAHQKGLKTASYYFRTNAAVSNQKVTVSSSTTQASAPVVSQPVVQPTPAPMPVAQSSQNMSIPVSNSTTDDDDDCIVCGS